jgi:tRNA threonylcarbamoyladenosine biosynthesis protein TsaE
MHFISDSVERTEAIAGELAARLGGGECIALYGELGAGKTQFVRGLARALGAEARAVSSPTFVLMNIYRGGRLAVFHLDAYRVHGVEDFRGIGFEELLDQGGVVVVEWAERITELLPRQHVDVRITATGEMERKISIETIQS